MPSPHEQTRRLQTNNCPQGHRNNRRLRRSTTQSRPLSTEKDAGHSVERRNMVQGEGKRKATTSSDHNTSNDDQAPTGSKSADTTGSDTTASKKTYWQAARKTARTSTKQRTAALLSHSSTHTERHTDNIRLLDTRRTFVEKSPRPSKNRPLHTTTDPGWTRCHQAHPRANNNGEANIWSKRLQD